MQNCAKRTLEAYIFIDKKIQKTDFHFAICLFISRKTKFIVVNHAWIELVLYHMIENEPLQGDS